MQQLAEVTKQCKMRSRSNLILLLLPYSWTESEPLHCELPKDMYIHFLMQGTVDAGFANTIINWAECTAILIAGVIILSMLGVNISGLFLPAGICIALASKDLAHNFVAGKLLMIQFCEYPYSH